MTELRILPERDERMASRVWPDPEPLEPGTVQEAREHLFELVDAPQAETADLFVDDLPLEALRSGRSGVALWRWTPGFHAGTVEMGLQLDGRRHDFELVTDPSERKLSREAFDTMVREILEDTFALFALTSFRKGLAASRESRPPPIARLEFLRSRMEELVRIVTAIDRQPRRVLRAELEAVPYHRAVTATGSEVLQSFRSGRLVRESAGARLPPALRGYLPEWIHQRVRRSSLDLPEHREMKASLQIWSQWLVRASILLAASAASGGDEPEERSVHRVWARRARRLGSRLEALLLLPLFEGVGAAAPRPVASALWRRDPRYRAFLRLHRDISLGLASVFGDFLNMPLARTFDLYELWVFLRLVRAAVERHGADEAALASLFEGRGMTLRTGAITVPLPAAGVALCFQRQYREFWVEQEGRGSYSREMRPDVAIEALEGDAARPLVVLDSKYRIGRDLNEALSSAHTYRDALVTADAGGGVRAIVRGAYLVTPDAPFVREDWKDTPLPGRLFHPAYRAGFHFGALTLRPGMSLVQVGSALDLVLADAA